MPDELAARLIDMAERSIDYHDRMFDTIHKLESESMSRIVWFVAIAGFALINVPIGASALGLARSTEVALVPWILTALLAVLAHWEFRNKGVRNLELYVAKREALMAYVVNGPNVATMADLTAILTHQKEPLPKLLRTQIQVTRLADILEFATLVTFVVSMGVTIYRLTSAL